MDQGCDGAWSTAECVGDVRVGQAAVEAEDQRGPLTMGEGGESVGQLPGAELGGFARAQVEPAEPPEAAMVGVAGVDDAAAEVRAVVVDLRPPRVQAHEAVLHEVGGDLR